MLTTVYTLSREAVGAAIGALAAVPAVSATWPTANVTIYVPFQVDVDSEVVQVFLFNGAAVSGNFDIGVYNFSGTKLGALGATAQAGVGVVQAVTVANIALTADSTYYLALWFSNTTATTFRVLSGNLGHLRALGVLQETNAAGLPTNFTPVAVAQDYLPCFGVTFKTVM